MNASTHSGYTDYEWAIVLNRTCLKFFDLWPDKNERKQGKVTFNIRVVITLTMIIAICIIPTLHSLIRIRDDLISIIDNLQYTLPIMMTILKILIMWRNKKALIPVIAMVKEDWIKFKTTKERNIMISRANTARIITIYGYFIMLLSFTSVAILPFFGISLRYMTNITDPGKPMPLQSYYIYNTDKSPAYEITFIMQSIALTSIAATYTSTDNFLGLLIFHVCGQLENLKERFSHLDDNNFESILLYRIVQDHLRIIRIVKTIDDTFNMMLLGLLIYFGSLFALYGFLIVTIRSQAQGLSFSRLFIIMLAFTNLFTHMCLYCFIGELLIIQCDAFYEAVCQYKWYKLKPEKARNLLIIMIRANKPLYLTAGKLFPMTMSTLCNLLKTSGGYVSVLLAYRK